METIKVCYTPDSLFSGWQPEDLAAVDKRASQVCYEELLAERLRAEFPGAQAEVSEGGQDWVEVNGERGSAEAAWVDKYATQVYQGYAWVVYRDVLAAEMIRPYGGPQYLVEPVGSVCDPEGLALFAEEGYQVLAEGIKGWGEYTHIIKAHDDLGGACYLAKLGGA